MYMSGSVVTRECFTNVAPEAKTSPVLARLRIESPNTNTAVAIRMIPIRAETLVTTLSTMIGTSRSAMTSHAIVDRAKVVIVDPVRMKTCLSRLAFV